MIFFQETHDLQEFNFRRAGFPYVQVAAGSNAKGCAIASKLPLRFEYLGTGFMEGRQ